MKTRLIATLIVPVLLCACAGGVDVNPMLRDFDTYAKDVREVATDEQALKTLDAGQAKRTEAGALAEKGKDKEALPMIEEAMADARLALEMDKMRASSQRAETCRLEVEQARVKWSEAVFILEQTEEFTGQKSPVETREPESPAAGPPLPTTTLADSLPPTIADVSSQWDAWRKAATEHKVAAPDIESAYQKSHDQTQAEKVDAATGAHATYLAARAVQALECRVRTDVNERVCLDATQHTAALGDARVETLRAALELERGLKDSLRGELEQLRAESKTRQDELYGALSSLEGKFASIRRDARGTIVSLADILFDFDKATLRRDVEFNLVKIATILNQFSEMKIVIEGHTDAVGSDEYNLGLSKRRAQAVRDFLASQGVVEGRLSSEGYGESRPVADNGTDEGRQKNRRVDLVIQDAP
jgi:outer membrane protein OmpA-like peptidoglycan-associated protein